MTWEPLDCAFVAFFIGLAIFLALCGVALLLVAVNA